MSKQILLILKNEKVLFRAIKMAVIVVAKTEKGLKIIKNEIDKREGILSNFHLNNYIEKYNLKKAYKRY